MALILGVLVGLAPFWPTAADGSLASRLLALFAADVALRRTACASALGLAVTAFVFFRSPAPEQTAAPAPKTPRPALPPSNVVGA